MFRNLIRSMAAQGYIKTSLAKAKSTKPLIEKLVTMARQPGLTSFRRLMQDTGNAETTKQLVSYGQLFAKRPGGYTRIIRLGHQLGDNTERVRLEFVEKIEKAIVVPKVAPKIEGKVSTKSGLAVGQKKVAAKKDPEKAVKKLKKTTKTKKS